MEVTFLKWAVLPLKILSLALLSVFARVFHDNEDAKKKKEITLALIMTRVTMSLFILITVFYLSKHYFSFDENTALLVAGGFSFAFREVMDTFLLVAKKPSSIRDIFRGKMSDTIDPKGDDYPDGEGSK